MPGKAKVNTAGRYRSIYFRDAADVGRIAERAARAAMSFNDYVVKTARGDRTLGSHEGETLRAAQEDAKYWRERFEQMAGIAQTTQAEVLQLRAEMRTRALPPEGASSRASSSSSRACAARTASTACGPSPNSPKNSGSTTADEKACAARSRRSSARTCSNRSATDGGTGRTEQGKGISIVTRSRAGGRMGARGTATLGILMALAMILPSALAGYLEAGVDAARTGASPDAGPVTDDVAWTLLLPGSRAPAAPPLLLNGSVYVLTANGWLGTGPYAYHDPALAENGLFRIDAATATATEVLKLAAPPNALASDGARFFVTDDTSVTAYDIATSAKEWSTPFPVIVAQHSRTFCEPPAVRAASLIVACHEIGLATQTTHDALVPLGNGIADGLAEIRTFAMLLDGATGKTRWTWYEDATDEARGSPSVPAPGTTPSTASPTVSEYTTTAGLSVIGARVFVATADATGTGGPGTFYLWAIDAATGALVYEENSSLAANQAIGAQTGMEPDFANAPTGAASAAYFKIEDRLVAFNPATGAELWSDNVRRADATAGDKGSGFALTPTALFAASSQTLYRYETLSHANPWRYTLLPATPESPPPLWAPDGLVLAGGTLYARATDALGDGNTSVNSIRAIDPETGHELWAHEFPSRVEGNSRLFLFAVGDGTIAVAGYDGSVALLGNTAASIATRVHVSTTFPRVGDLVSADLSGSGPGKFGAPTSFRADWGDGTVTDWSANPIATHAYASRAPFVARFSARNAANQSASVFVTMHAGETAPTFLERAFAAENQNVTFFALGLVVTLASALVGFFALRRRRRALSRELAALDDLERRIAERPATAPSALTARRTRADELLLAGHLDAAQHRVLERRIDELARRSRLGALDGRFDFLPHGMVRRLHEMLADGQVSAWERARFLEALAADGSLTGPQKEEVRALVEGWFAADAGVHRAEPRSSE
ncbi:MAG: outer membrane protein assembly factor BamB family protein [Thermoplasmatota archaeon]